MAYCDDLEDDATSYRNIVSRSIYGRFLDLLLPLLLLNSGGAECWKGILTRKLYRHLSEMSTLQSMQLFPGEIRPDDHTNIS